MNVRFRLITLLFFFIPLISFSQWDCRSSLNSHLKPIYKKSNLLWAAEFTSGLGVMNDRNIVNTMFFVGLNYYKKNNEFYIEGGMKGWGNTLYAPENKNNSFFIKKRRPGLREAFYNLKSEKINIKAGFQSMTMNDFLLVNERGFGIDISKTIGNLDFSVKGASVIKDLARMGSYCSVKYLYNLVHSEEELVLGNKIGETNFSGLVLTWNIPETKTQKDIEQNSDSSDEFKSVDESDEFKSVEGNDEFSEFKSVENTQETITKSKFSLRQFVKKTGIIVYSEYGASIGQQKIFAGSFAEFATPFKTKFETEAIFQNISDNNAIIYHLKLSKRLSISKKQKLYLGSVYTGKININDNAFYSARFSNLFLGEILRLDAPEIPIIQAFVKYNLVAKTNPYFKLQYVSQLQTDKIKEADFEFSIKLFKHFRLTNIVSYIDSKLLENPFFMERIEMRFSF